MTSALPAFFQNRPRLFFLGKFALFFGLLQLVSLLSEPRLPLFIQTELTARPAAWLINTISPMHPVHLDGNSLIGNPSGQLVVGLGCEALGAILLYVAALSAVALGPWARIRGLFAGVLAISLFNLARITSLYYVLLFWPGTFDLIHEYVGQILTVLVASGLFLLFSQEFDLSRFPLAKGLLAWLACVVLTLVVLFHWGQSYMKVTSLLPISMIQGLIDQQNQAVEQTLARMVPESSGYRAPRDETRVRGSISDSGYGLRFAIPALAPDSPAHPGMVGVNTVDYQKEFSAYPLYLLVLLTLPLILVLPYFPGLARLSAALLHLSLLSLFYGMDLFVSFLEEYVVLFRPLLDDWAGLKMVASKASLFFLTGGDYFYAVASLATAGWLFARRPGRQADPAAPSRNPG